MGRRALRKVDPNLDLSRHLCFLDELPRPWNADALFAQPGPLEVEVGSGKGLFLQRAATAHPDRNFLGVEIARKYAVFTAARLAKLGLGNALVVHGDAVRLFAELLPDASVSAVHIYFPDPWWKKRHKKRRIMRLEFVQHVERVLVPGGRLHFWTDVAEYFQASCQLLVESTGLLGPFPVPEQPAQHDMDYRTHFERRVRLHQQTVYRAEFHKPPKLDSRPFLPSRAGN